MLNIEKHFNKALDCQKGQKPDVAIALYQEILDSDPNHLPTLYNLATLLGEQGDYAKAQEYYDTLLTLEPDFVRAYYNCAICHLNQKNVERARQLLIEAVNLVPEYAEAQHLLGSVLFKLGQFDTAYSHLMKALAEAPDDAQIMTHLGMTLIWRGQLDDAKFYLEQAIANMPYLAEAQYHLGVIALKRGALTQAQAFFEAALDRDEAHFGALYNLGLLNKQAGFFKIADDYLRRAQAIEPDNQTIAFLRHAINQDGTPSQPPDNFVHDLFNRYAFYYDEQMVQGLDYQVPQALYQAFETLETPAHQLNIVDLGCGTGLSGQAFKPFAKKLIGIDMSENMLARARDKQIYDDVLQGDIIDTLNGFEPRSVDVILAADVLGYLGDLSPLFDAVARVLKIGGYFVFSIESGDAPYHLSQHVRFTHSEDYLKSLADQHKMSLQVNEAITLRKGQSGRVMICFKS